MAKLKKRRSTGGVSAAENRPPWELIATSDRRALIALDAWRIRSALFAERSADSPGELHVLDHNCDALRTRDGLSARQTHLDFRFDARAPLRESHRDLNPRKDGRGAPPLPLAAQSTLVLAIGTPCSQTRFAPVVRARAKTTPPPQHNDAPVRSYMSGSATQNARALPRAQAARTAACAGAAPSSAGTVGSPSTRARRVYTCVIPRSGGVATSRAGLARPGHLCLLIPPALGADRDGVRGAPPATAPPLRFAGCERAHV